MTKKIDAGGREEMRALTKPKLNFLSAIMNKPNLSIYQIKKILKTSNHTPIIRARDELKRDKIIDENNNIIADINLVRAAMLWESIYYIECSKNTQLKSSAIRALANHIKN